MRCCLYDNSPDAACDVAYDNGCNAVLDVAYDNTATLFAMLLMTLCAMLRAM